MIVSPCHRGRPGRAPRRRRSGASIVEFAIVGSFCLMLFLGVIDYGRIMYVRQLMDNAAREGARYAVVHTHDKTTADIEAYVRSQMVQQDQILGATISIYKASTVDGSNIGVWTAAGFGETIGVQINVTLRPFVPRLLLMSTTVPLQSKATMYSEAN